jgi:carbonic anhydrase/acetyltransferase-like protein (isoleucine patch superfamily)
MEDWIPGGSERFVKFSAHGDRVMKSRSMSSLAVGALCLEKVAAARLASQAAVMLCSTSSMIRSYKGIKPTIPASCYVDQSAQIIGDVVLGEHASVWMNAVVRGDVHEIRIGAHSNVQDCSVLHGMKERYGVYVGEYVTVGHSVTLHGCVVEERCLIGMGCVVLNGARIGAGSILAAGTLIPEGTIVEPGSLWMGSPGKFRRKLEEKDQQMILMYANNYLGYKEAYLKEKYEENLSS